VEASEALTKNRPPRVQGEIQFWSDQ